MLTRDFLLLLCQITKAFRAEPDLQNLLFNDFFNQAIHKSQPGWRRIIAQTSLWGIPTPAFSTALAFFDGYRTANLPASLLQAQRDYFGAHTFRILPEHASESYPEGQDIHGISRFFYYSALSSLVGFAVC
jgi:6-phosphogluconate dehydrogenase